MCAAGCTLAALLACTDYNGIGVLIICALYLTRGDRKRQCIVGAVLFAWELTAPLAFVLVWFYNGQRARAVRCKRRLLLVLPGAPERAGCGDESSAVKKQNALFGRPRKARFV